MVGVDPKLKKRSKNMSLELSDGGGGQYVGD